MVNFSPDGATTQNRTITIVDDGIVESTESFTVTVTAVSNNVDIDPTDSAVIEIQDNDGRWQSYSADYLFLFDCWLNPHLIDSILVNHRKSEI